MDDFYDDPYNIWTQDNTNDKRDPIVQKVVKKFQLRSLVGIEKYGTTLHDSPDDFYKFLNHLQEELMDACLYLEKLKSQKF